MFDTLRVVSGRVTSLQEVHRQIARLHHEALDLVAAIGTAPGENDWAREEISAALHISAYAADQMLTTSRALASRLPQTKRALEAGDISYPHAVRLAEATAELSTETAARVEATVLPAAQEQTPGQFARTAAKAVALADPVAAELVHEQAAEQRQVVLYPEPHGMATLAATLPAAEAVRVFTALDVLAGRAAADDPRGVDARRADALVGLATDALSAAPPVLRQGRPVQVNVTMSVQTALGLSDEPAELRGYGPIPASMARRLADDGEWLAFLTDATGELKALGQRRYRPGQRLADFIVARDQVCTFPHCRQPAERCDIDHALPFPHGPTDEHNCGALCRRHHRAKHEAGWSLTRHPDGSCTWVSPLGFRYDVRPPSYGSAN